MQIFALLDANGSEAVDAGDKIGFYGDADDFSTLLIVDADADLTDIDIEFTFDVRESLRHVHDALDLLNCRKIIRKHLRWCSLRFFYGKDAGRRSG
ncbi:MAG: hypothetical protein R2860_02155 [Desulfobacterales bacterium]